jgi:ACS family hexuronate transporter-like MFS transporter
VVAVPLLTAVAVHLGWRWVFFASGAVGCSLGVFWWVKYRPPQAHARLEAAERAYIAAGESSEAQAITRWRDLLWRREVWGLMLAKALTDSAWSFLTTWLPRYLANERGYDLAMIGSVAWIPYACAGVGSFAGGALGTWLIHRGASVHRSRRICLLLAACLMPATLAIVATPTSIAIACFSVGLFAHQVWSSNLQARSTDLFPVSLVGSVMGLMGCAGAAAGAVFQLIAGDLIGRRGYAVPFAFTGVAYLIAFLGLTLLARKAEPTGMRTQVT